MLTYKQQWIKTSYKYAFCYQLNHVPTVSLFSNALFICFNEFIQYIVYICGDEIIRFDIIDQSILLDTRSNIYLLAIKCYYVKEE